MAYGYSDDDSELAAAIHRTFSSEDGKVVLQWILDQCGYFATAKDRVDPALIAFAGRLMEAGHMGISGDSGIFVTALLSSYTSEGI